MSDDEALQTLFPSMDGEISDEEPVFGNGPHADIDMDVPLPSFPPTNNPVLLPKDRKVSALDVVNKGQISAGLRGRILERPALSSLQIGAL